MDFNQTPLHEDPKDSIPHDNAIESIHIIPKETQERSEE